MLDFFVNACIAYIMVMCHYTVDGALLYYRAGGKLYKYTQLRNKYIYTLNIEVFTTESVLAMLLLAI